MVVVFEVFNLLKEAWIKTIQFSLELHSYKANTISQLHKGHITEACGVCVCVCVVCVSVCVWCVSVCVVVCVCSVSLCVCVWCVSVWCVCMCTQLTPLPVHSLASAVLSPSSEWPTSPDCLPAVLGTLLVLQHLASGS